jgi:methionyl-tRNA formyltransferase
VAWAIYHGEKQTGVTIIRMSVQLDAGDMLLQESVAIGPDETAGEVEARLAIVGARLAVEALDQIAKGTAKGMSQDKSLASKAPKLKKEDGLVDWSRDAYQVCNQIRAMQPWPTAYTFLHQSGRAPVRIGVIRASVVHVSLDGSLQPGRLSCVNLPGPREPILAVETGSRAFVVRIHELPPAGKRRMWAAEFLRGHPLQEGDCFGPEKP